MSHLKIQQLANKFFQKLEKTADFNSQREQDEKFQQDFQKQFRSLLNEMEGDLVSLKHKDLDRSVWKQFALLWKNLLEIYKNNNMQALVDYVNELSAKSVIENLQAAVQQHLQDTAIDFGGKLLSQLRVESLRNLINLSQMGQEFFRQSPEDNVSPRTLPTVPPPSKSTSNEQKTVEVPV
jgi:hypothetical protein